MLLALRLGALLGLIDTLATGLRMPLLRGGLQEVLLRIAVAVPSWCVACALGLLAVRVSRKLLGRAPAPALEIFLGVALASLAPLLLSAQALHAAGSLGLSLSSGLVIAVASSALAGALAALLARRGGIGLVPWAATTLILLLIQLPLAGRTESSHGQRNVILVSLDTLRADHLGTYGYARDTSPNLDRLAKGGLVFEQAMSASHWTLPSHAALLTGKDPVALGVLDTGDALSSRFVTLAEEFDNAGWHTAAFVGNSPASFIGAQRGFDQGFDLYEHLPVPHRGLDAHLLLGLSKLWYKQVDHAIGAATHQIDLVGRWLESRPDAPFFLFLHLFDVHSDAHRLPYEAPGEFEERFISDPELTFTGCHPSGLCASELLMAYATGELEERPDPAEIQRMVDLYDGGIAYTDAEIGRLLELLDRHGLREDTILAVTSDHGEAFWEHGVPLHRDLHRENLHVPLILGGPGVPAERSGVVVQNLDLAPTLLELAGLGPRSRSLMNALNSPKGAGSAFSASREQLAWTTNKAKLLGTWRREWEELAEGAEVFSEIDELSGEPVESGDSPLGLALLEWLRTSRLLHASVVGDGAGPSLELTEQDWADLRAIGYGE